MSKIIAGLVLMAAVVGGAYYLGSTKSDKDLKAAEAAEAAAVATAKAVSAPHVGDASTTPALPSATVSIQKGVFDPATITVKKGDTVIWMNNDSVAHTVTSDEGGLILNSQSIAAGHAFAHRFTDEGTVTYHCAIDPAMKGVVVVKN